MRAYKPMRSCRLADDLYLKAKHIADSEHRSFNNWLESVLIKIVAEYERENGVIEVKTDETYE